MLRRCRDQILRRQVEKENKDAMRSSQQNTNGSNIVDLEAVLNSYLVTVGVRTWKNGTSMAVNIISGETSVGS